MTKNLKLWVILTCIDRWAVFGHYDRVAKLIAAQFSIEPLPVLDGIILDHQVVSNCQRRRPYEPRCRDLDCIECDGIFVDLTFLWSMNVAPMLARALFKILPINIKRMGYRL